MAAMEISGHNQVYQHVLATFEKTNDFIEEHQDDEDKADEIKEKINKDLSETLVLILDNFGRQKAISALEIYREHEKVKNKLLEMSDEPEVKTKQQSVVDDGFLQIQAQPVAAVEAEEEKKEMPTARTVRKRQSSHKIAAQQASETKV